MDQYSRKIHRSCGNCRHLDVEKILCRATEGSLRIVWESISTNSVLLCEGHYWEPLQRAVASVDEYVRTAKR